MRALALALTFFALSSVASAAPSITEVHPPAGFPWGGTQVTIQGTDLLGEPFRFCYDLTPCPITVLFGDVPGDVGSAFPTHITVTAPAHVRGVTSVRIKVAGRPDAHLPDAFNFTDLAAEFASGDWTELFVPVSANDVPGAYGSIWRTELNVHNPTEFTVPLDGYLCDAPNASACPRVSLSPGQTKSIMLYPGRGEGGTLWVPNGIVDQLSLSLRVRDLSRNADDWGTELPVVRWAMRAFVQRLLDVPTDPRYRVLLRAFGGSSAIVRVHPLSGTDVLDELRFGPGENYNGVVIDPITPAVRASGRERVRVVVEFPPGPLDDPPTGGWAFISLTNNQTQHVTIISPQK